MMAELEFLQDCNVYPFLPSKVSICLSPQDRQYHSGAFGGIFQRDDLFPQGVGCRSPNPATGSCSCPRGFDQASYRALTFGKGQEVVGTTVTFCVNASYPLNPTTDTFGGVYQMNDKGTDCLYGNPFNNGDCSCQDGYSLTQTIRAIADGPIGGSLYFCTPTGSADLPPLPTWPELNETKYIYVSAQNGSDSNSGLSPETPFATLDRAFATLSQSQGSNRNLTLRLMSGTSADTSTFSLNETARLSPADAITGWNLCGSRGDAMYVTVEGYFSGGVKQKPILSGGLELNGWTAVSGHQGVWVATVPDQALAADPFVMQMWEAETGARVPLTALDTAQYAAMHHPHSQDNISLSISNPHHLTNDDVQNAAMVYIYHSWTSSLSIVKEMTFPSTDEALLHVQGSIPDNIFNTASGNRYRLVNLQRMDLLRPGSFFFSPTAKTVTYRVPNADRNSTTPPRLIIPVLHTVLSVENSCANLILQDFTVSHTVIDTSCLSYGCSGQSATFLPRAALEISSMSEFITLEQLHLAHVGSYALWVHEQTNSIRVVKSTFWDLGAGGVRVGEAISGSVDNPTQLASNILLIDNEIFDGGYIIESGCGVLLQQAASCHLLHNSIHDLYYTGISTGWTWGYALTSNENLNVASNRIFNIGRGRLSDMGCIYNLGISPGTVFDHNLCHDVQSYGYGGWGYYSDEGTSYVLWTNNIVYRTKGAGVHIHYGLYIEVINNIVAFPEQVFQSSSTSNGDFAGIRSSQSWSGYEHISQFTLKRNIVLLRNKTATLFFRTIPKSFYNTSIDYNLYWSYVEPTSSLTFPTWSSGSSTFAQWKLEGKDVHSVLADPAMPSASSYNFTLSSTSPAFGIGFVPISEEGFGSRV
jgi:hypothetical protein